MSVIYLHKEDFLIDFFITGLSRRSITRGWEWAPKSEVEREDGVRR